MTDNSLTSELGALSYDPAPESASLARLQPSYGLFIDGQFTDPSRHQQFASINPATEETIATVAMASATDVDAAVSSARRAYNKVWSKTSGAQRAKYLYRIARLIQERSRELAVVETLDNGKPIRETRDIDVPLAAAYFFYYAGWADKLEYAGFGRESPTSRRRGADHPVELSAADGGLETGTGPRGGQHVRVEARGDDATHRPHPGRDSSAGGTT